jgi:hypothetical protein
MAARLAPFFNQARALQVCEMLGNRLLRHGEGSRQLSDCRRSARKPSQNRPPRRVRERSQCCTKTIHTHMVVDYARINSLSSATISSARFLPSSAAVLPPLLQWNHPLENLARLRLHHHQSATIANQTRSTGPPFGPEAFRALSYRKALILRVQKTPNYCGAPLP